MTADREWEPAFLAMSTLLGEPVESSLAALGDAGSVAAAELVGALQSTSRDVRARAIARTVAAVVAELDAARLA